jgi:osmoprotectant transport system substrate-binding protein
VVVASFNFSESVLLADIYGQALEQAGIPVRMELDLGPREQVLPAVHQGLVDVVPEYLGSLLEALVPDAQRRGAPAAEERARLVQALRPWKVSVLPEAPAEDQNGLVVTTALAKRYGLSTISQLAPVAPRLALGAPAECPDRPFCLLGLRSVYGLRFARFQPFDEESQRITALEEQVVDVAVLDTTDGELATGNFVVLADDRHLQPADNIAPIVADRAISDYGARLTGALDAVSAELSSSGLSFLDWRVDVAGKDPAAEAHGWLVREGLVPRR